MTKKTGHGIVGLVFVNPRTKGDEVYDFCEASRPMNAMMQRGRNWVMMSMKMVRKMAMKEIGRLEKLMGPELFNRGLNGEQPTKVDDVEDFKSMF